MKKRNVRIFGWTVAAALLGVSVSEATAQSIYPALNVAVEQKKAVAKTLLAKGSYAESFDMFMSLLREEPDDEDINVGLALAAQGAKKYPHMLLAYERLLDKQPRNALYRIQIARAYLFLDDRESARHELNLARQYDPRVEDKDIEDVLLALQKQASRWRYSGRLAAGLMYDSNANQGPNSNTLTLGSFDNLFIDGVRKEGSWGAYGSATIDGGYRLDDGSRWWLVGDLGAYQRWNASSSLNANNAFSWGRTAAGIRYIGDEFLIDVRIKGELGKQYHDASRDQTVSSFGPEATFSWSVGEKTQLITRAGLEKRHYTVVNYRGGQYWWVGEYLRHVFDSNNYEVVLGGRALGANVETREFGYDGWEGSVRFLARLPHDVTLVPYVVFKREDYNGPATALETKKRRDDQWRFGLMLTWDIDKDWAVEFGYQYVDTKSNSALYDYGQHVVNMGIVWKF